MVSFNWPEPKMLMELFGSLPLAMKSIVGTLVFWITSSIVFFLSK